MIVLLPLFTVLLAALLAALAGVRRAAWVPAIGIVLTGAAFGAVLWGWSLGGGTVDVAWAPSWNLRLHFTLDGLAALYGLLATGIGFAILVYSAAYIPRHLKQEGRPTAESTRFFAMLLLFMAAMVGLALAQDLLLLFLFWDLTAITSYFLIGYDSHKAEAREAALMAFLVTGITSVLFIIGALLLYGEYQTFSLPLLIQQVEPGTAVTTAVSLIVLAALAKSAQVPFHFWLPRAMAAPTPVSAYLHSAAMVAAGVFLLGRIYPLLLAAPRLLDVLQVIGLISIFLGGLLALAQDVLKRVLAYSTIAQYGYVVFMLGLGGEAGVAGASFYVIAHALCKSGLFLTAGAVTEATGENKLSRLGGWGRPLPILAAGSALAAAGLAGLPLTIGFFKDELFFAAALEHGWPFAALAVLGAAVTLAYTWRFWSGIFLGRPVSGSDGMPDQPETAGSGQGIPAGLVWPVAGLGLLVLLGGILPSPAAHLAEAAGSATLGAPTPVESAYHLDARPENLMALATYGIGVLLICLSRRHFLPRAAAAVANWGERLGPEQWYRAGLNGLSRVSDWIYRRIVPDLAGSLVFILVPTAILLLIGWLATSAVGEFAVSPVQLGDLPLILLLGLTAVAAITLLLVRRHLTQVLVLSTVSYSLAAAYVFFGAPDVALVMILIGTVSSLFFLGVLVLVPPEVLEDTAAQQTARRLRLRDNVVGGIAGVFALITSWRVLSQPVARESVAAEYIRLTPVAHAGNVVTAVLADFRGLDTLGEVTVIVIALVGIVSLLSRVERP
ncbi:MAG: DUF4040 domain-containing protein [Anaerolineaceae bacterium]|nr:DUF4040 domain-containing protein [Anaerolineaceae bacterium]